jgi:hypothetical protein
MVLRPIIVKNKKYRALLFAGAITGLNNYVLVSTPATEEFCNSSPALIISSANKSIGIEKYADDKCVCAVKNYIIRPADLRGEVIGNVKAGKSLIYDLRHFGNYEAGAN